MNRVLFAIFVFLTAPQVQAATKKPIINMEILNKGKDIWVKIKNGDEFVGENASKATLVPGGIIKEGKKPVGTPFAIAGIDISKETELYIYFKEPTSVDLPDKAYKFDPNKTVYVTWNPNERVKLYPQTGPKLSIKKTKSGLSLANNVVVTAKENNITDVTELAKLTERPPSPIRSIPEIDNLEHSEQIAQSAASTLVEKPQDLDSLWQKWCDPNGNPEYPTSIFCAAGMGNSFALLILRIRFVLPENKKEFNPSSHVLKLAGAGLPPQPGFDLKGIYDDLLGKKSEKQKELQWNDFDAFVSFFKESKHLSEYVNKAFMYPYGLSTENLADPTVKKEQAKELTELANKAMTGIFSSAPKFPSTYNAKAYLSPSALFKAKCQGGLHAAWKGTLFCAIGEGNLSATYLARIAFVKPTNVLPQPEGQEPKPQPPVHAISMLLDKLTQGSVAASWGLKRQLGDIVERLNTSTIVWEDLRNILVALKMDWTETAVSIGNPYFKPYGIEIAPQRP